MIRKGVISFKYRTVLNKIYKIPNGVKKIGDWAFAHAPMLRKIIIPDTVEIIGERAFYSSDLIEINIPKSVKTIDAAAFSCCKKLRKVTLHEGLKSIGFEAFLGCSSLEEIDVPSSVEKLGYKVFSSCESLRKVTLHEGLKSIDFSPFLYCSLLEEIDIPSSVDKLQDRVFNSCEFLRKVTLHEGLKSIGSEAFLGCSSLEEIDIPSSVDKLENKVFDSCESLRKVTLHEGLKSIGSEAFSGCRSLEEIDIPPLVTKICVGTFNDCKSLRKILHTENIEFIDKNAFLDCSELQELCFSSKIKVINANAFKNCQNLNLNINTSLFYINFDSFEDTFNVKTLVLYNHSINMSDYKNDIRNVRIKELNDKIDEYLFKNNIFGPKYSNVFSHDYVINDIVVKLEKDEHYDYIVDFDKYMKYFIQSIKNQGQISSKTNFNIFNNISNNVNDNVPTDLKEYASKIGMEEKMYEIKKQIDGYLIMKSISEPKYFSYSIHQGVIKEMIDCLQQNKDYNYISAVYYYMDNYVKSINPETSNVEKIPKKYETITDLYYYGKKINLLDKIDEIKQSIDEILKRNGIIDEKYYLYSKHEGFIKEMLDCLHQNKDYNYTDALNNYMHYFIEGISQKKQIINSDKQIDNKFNKEPNKQDENEVPKLKQEIENLKQQLSNYQENDDTYQNIDKENISNVSLSKPNHR